VRGNCQARQVAAGMRERMGGTLAWTFRALGEGWPASSSKGLKKATDRPRAGALPR